MRYHSLVYKAIYDKYVPRIEVEGKKIPDPDVLFVGPFLDGILPYIPEIFNYPFQNTSRVEERRAQLKGLILNSRVNPDRAVNILARDFTFKFSPREGGPSVILGERVVDEEPGELLNSPQLIRHPETGELTLLMYKKGSRDTEPFKPVIRVDKQHGLHYLRKDDKFEISFLTRNKEAMQYRYILRPLGEGSSLLTPERAVDVVVW